MFTPSVQDFVRSCAKKQTNYRIYIVTRCINLCWTDWRTGLFFYLWSNTFHSRTTDLPPSIQAPLIQKPLFHYHWSKNLYSSTTDPKTSIPAPLIQKPLFQYHWSSAYLFQRLLRHILWAYLLSRWPHLCVTSRLLLLLLFGLWWPHCCEYGGPTIKSLVWIPTTGKWHFLRVVSNVVYNTVPSLFSVFFHFLFMHPAFLPFFGRSSEIYKAYWNRTILIGQNR